MLRMELPGKRKRGTAKMRFMDAVGEDIAGAEVTEEDAEGSYISTKFLPLHQDDISVLTR